MTYGKLKTDHYPPASKLLHWLIAACVLITIPVAIAMNRVDEGPAQDALYNLHKSLGVLIFMLMVVRLINRVMAGVPAPDPTIARWQKAASSAVHGLLYVLLVAMPIGGYVANSAYGVSTPFFGLFELPPIIAKNEALSERMFAVHTIAGWALGVLALMHIGAALQHHFIHRDNVLRRMLPRMLGGL
jgi:cytochrome b561